jgi:superfamily II DNA or RNA helicase
MPTLQLHDFQETFKGDIRNALRQPAPEGKNKRRVIAQLPTGGGKTVTASSMIQSSAKMGYQSIFIVHGRQLVFQASRTLDRYGIDHGVIMAGAHPKSVHAPVQVASVDTLASWLRKGNDHMLPYAQLLIVDEAHESTSGLWQTVLGHYSDSVIVGLTATPAKGDGSGLGEVYQDIVQGPSVQWLTDHGFLVPADYYSLDVPDLSGVGSSGGDWIGTQLDEFMSGKALVGDVVKTWRKHADGRPTIVFAAGVRHSKYIEEAFQTAGVRAFHIDANTPQADRDKAFQAIAAGDLDVLTNNRVLNRGFDCPAIEVCIDAAPTQSHVMHLQKLGRVLRTSDGKDRCLILDHTGNLLRHGPVTREHAWDLDPGEDGAAERARERLEALGKEMVCPQCGAIFTGHSRCVKCGWEIPQGEATPQNIQQIAGELRKLTPEYWDELRAERERELTGDQKREWFGMLLYEAKRRGYSHGWAAHVYKARTGAWPNHHIKGGAIEAPPTPEVTSYISLRDTKRRKAIRA